ncbi:uncharacterized protein JCM6883_006509 [Sporobolomyces salmoneus]|uniref:uncharacterized protein n=1 Tax=Sporobolomyces salmoneus TaxID=183962 RepID=UPI00317103DF
MSTPNKAPTPLALRKLASTLVEKEPIGAVRKRRQTSAFSLSSNAGTPPPRQRGSSTKPETAESEELTDLDEEDDEEEEEEEEETKRNKKNVAVTFTPPKSRGRPKGRKSIKQEEEFGTEEFEKVLRDGLEKIPQMGKRSIVMNGQKYGRTGLLVEFVRRQTGKIKKKEKLSAHLATLRRNAQENDDTELLKLLDGKRLRPKQDLYKLDFDQVLGPDLHPETLAQAQEAIEREKAAKSKPAAEQNDIESSAQKGKKRARNDSDSERESEKDEEEEAEERPKPKKTKPVPKPTSSAAGTPVKRGRGRPRKYPRPDDVISSSPSSTPASSKKSQPAKTSKLRQTVSSPVDDGNESSDLSSVDDNYEEERGEKPNGDRAEEEEQMEIDEGETGSLPADNASGSSWLAGGLKKIFSWLV